MPAFFYLLFIEWWVVGMVHALGWWSQAMPLIPPYSAYLAIERLLQPL